MKKLIIARYGEIHLKGDNRGFFLKVLKDNLTGAVGSFCKINIENSRILVTDFPVDMTDLLIFKIANTFGIVSVSAAVSVVAEPNIILDYIRSLEIEGSFKVEVNRADKKFPVKSTDFAPIVGELILKQNPLSHVDVKHPNTTVFIDIRETGNAFIYDKVVKGVGGMPVNTGGRALVLLSGGIDSPVAAYLSAKRGLKIDCVHFASPPYTSDFALDKVKQLKSKLEGFCGKINLIIVPFTEIQEELRARCRAEYMITLMRRFMVRISENIALENKIDCIITGENLSQVASQTIQGIASNNICARTVPILRPLITYDKTEIIEIAKKIDTYGISILPYMDCCTVFVPKHPSIKPNIQKLEEQEKNLDLEKLIHNCLRNKYCIS